MLENREQIDRSVPVPLYYQLKEAIREEIRAGAYQPGDVIPTEMEISEMFSLSRTTVRQAITELVQEGLLIRRKSKGTFVCEPKVTRDSPDTFDNALDSIEAMGMEPGTEILAFEVMEAKEAGAEVMDRLGLEPEQKVVYLYRKRLANGDPLVLVRSYLVYDLVKEVLEEDFQKERLYTILGRKKSSRVVRVVRDVIAAQACQEDALQLGIKKGKLILTSESVGYNASQVPVEYSLIRYREKRVRVEAKVPSGMKV